MTVFEASGYDPLIPLTPCLSVPTVAPLTQKVNC